MMFYSYEGLLFRSLNFKKFKHRLNLTLHNFLYMLIHVKMKAYH